MPKFNKREALRGKTRSRGMNVVCSRAKEAPTDDGSLSFVFVSDDNAGERYDWGSGETFSEVLDINGATSERLNTFFKDHSRDVDSAIGKISNVRAEDGQLIGDVTFGSDANSQEIFSKYREGILTDVSIGYEIRDYEVTRGAENEQDIVTVTNFDIFEVSAVGIGFDGGAKKRSGDNDGSPIMDEKQLERLAQLEAMSKRNEKENGELRGLLDAQKLDVEKAERVKLDAERKQLDLDKVEVKREKLVMATVADFGQRGIDALESFGDAKPTDEQLRAKILASFVGDTSTGFQPKADTQDARGKMIDAMVDGLAMRVGAKIEKPVEGSEKYRHASLATIANELLPESERSFDPSIVAKRSLVTGDFPLLLQSVGSRVLTNEFEAQLGSYQVWMKMVDVPDFRSMTDLTTSFGGGRLTKIKERADLKKLGGTEQGETWNIETFGNSFELSREMLINDDLGNFTNLVGTFARMAQTTANGISYDLLQNEGDYSNYKMADGSGIWIAGRNNTTNTALSSDALSTAKLKMAKHLSVDKKTPLNIRPKYLVIPPALEVKALEILGALSKVGADNVNVPNVNKDAYQIVIDSEISSDTAWYLLAESRTFKMGFLAGTNRSPVIEQTHSSVSGSEFEGVFDIGVMCEDYRGIFRGNV